MTTENISNSNAIPEEKKDLKLFCSKYADQGKEYLKKMFMPFSTA